MSDILFVLAESIFRNTCAKLNFDLSNFEIDEPFCAFLTAMSLEGSNEEGKNPSDILVWIATEFATNEGWRENFLSVRNRWVANEYSKIVAKA